MWKTLFTFALLSLSGRVSAQAPAGVPIVRGVDQTPTRPADWGRCTRHVEAFARNSSHWCRFNRLTPWPNPPTAAAQRALKFGRMTVYRGGILRQRFACNVQGQGSNTHATIALSTKYLKTFQGGWAVDRGACGYCVCMRVHGGDIAYNPGLHRDAVRRRIGLTFMARVSDRCGECSSDAVDVLQDRPFSYAPNIPADNPNAPRVNRLPGPRGFNESSGRFSPESVGTWVADWQFVPCNWTHTNCARFMRGFGYNTYTPLWRPGRPF